MKRWGWEKSIVLSVRNTNNLKHLCDKALFFFSGIWGKCRTEDEKIFKGEESIETFKFFRLINKYQIKEKNTSHKIRFRNISYFFLLFPWKNKAKWFDE